MGGRDPQIENRYQVLIDTHWREKKNPQLDPCYWNCKPSRIRRKFLNQQREETNYAHKKGTVRNFPPLITDTRREWNNILKILKTKNSQPRIIYPLFILQTWRRYKDFPRQTKAEEFITIIPAWWKGLKGVLWAENERTPIIIVTKNHETVKYNGKHNYSHIQNTLILYYSSVLSSWL
jgi:hypothetical protein